MVRPYSAVHGGRTRQRFTTALIAILLPVWLVGLASSAGCKAGQAELHELDGVEALKARFNADRGKPRIVLLLSPT